MRIFEIIPAVIFVLSSGLLFNTRFRENQFLVIIAGAIALVASYFLFEEVTKRIVLSQMEKQQETSKPARPAPTPAPASAPRAPAPQSNLSPVDQILASIKPAVCPSYTEDQTRAATSRLLQAGDKAGQQGDGRLRVQYAEQALGLWLCLPDQNDTWIRNTGDDIIGTLGAAKFQLGERRDGCALILRSYQRAKQRNDIASQKLALVFVPSC
jgi:hypothetical protein